MAKYGLAGFSVKTENMNWHLWSDGARNGLRVMKPAGGGVGFYWNYTKKTWEYYGHQPIER